MPAPLSAQSPTKAGTRLSALRAGVVKALAGAEEQRPGLRPSRTPSRRCCSPVPHRGHRILQPARASSVGYFDDASRRRTPSPSENFAATRNDAEPRARSQALSTIEVMRFYGMERLNPLCTGVREKRAAPLLLAGCYQLMFASTALSQPGPAGRLPRIPTRQGGAGDVHEDWSDIPTARMQTDCRSLLRSHLTMRFDDAPPPTGRHASRHQRRGACNFFRRDS